MVSWPAVARRRAISGAIHLEDSWVAAGRALAGCNGSAGEEAKFHEAASVVDGKVDAVEDRDIALAQMQERAGGVIATELQHLSGSGSSGTTRPAGFWHLSLHDVIITGY